MKKKTDRPDHHERLLSTIATLVIHFDYPV